MPRYLGQGVAEKLGKLAGLPPEEREVVAYGLEYLVTLIIGLALMLSIGLALGRLLEALAILCCWVMMRLFAGGAHCTALWRCGVANCAGMLAALLVNAGAVYLLPVPLWVSAATAWTLLTTGLWAPNNSERPVHDPRRRGKVRRRALVLVGTIGLLLLYLSLGGPLHWQLPSAAGATGLAFGGFMISPIGFRLTGGVDHRLDRLGRYLRKGGDLQ